MTPLCAERAELLVFLWSFLASRGLSGDPIDKIVRKYFASMKSRHRRGTEFESIRSPLLSAQDFSLEP